ncbi:MAG: radical SAM protein, partial [Ginsengibacter sp.]
KNLHDLNRVFIKNSGTYDAALNGLNLLKKYRVQFGVIVVFTDEVACDIDNAEKIYKHFKSLGIKYYDVHPSLTPKDVSGLSSLYNVTTEHYSSFMLRIFELWLSDNNDDITIRFIEDFIHNLAGLGTNSCYSAGKCIEIAGIDPDGSVSPCTRPFKNKYIFGNAAETQISEIFNSATFNQFTAEEAIGKSATKECIWSRLCGQGGCPHERLNIKTQQQDISGKHIYCTCDTNAKGGYPALFSGMIKRLNNYLA